MRFAIVIAAALLLCASVVAGSPSGFLSDSDRANLKATILAGQDAKTGAFGCICSTADAVVALQALKAEVPNKSAVCKFASASITASSSVGDISAAVTVTEALGCGAKVSDDVKKTLTTAATADGSTLSTYVAAGSALAALKKGSHVSGADSAIVGAANNVIDLVDEDGTFRADAEQEYGTVAEAGKALTFLATIAESGAMKGSDAEALAGVVEKLEDLIAAAEGPEDGEYLEILDADSEGESSLVPTARILSAAARLATATKTDFPVSRDQLGAFGEFFVLHKHAVDATEARWLLAGFDAVANNKFFTPLVLTVDRSTIVTSAHGEEGHVVVSVTDILGRKTVDCRVYLVTAVPETNEDTIFLNNQELSAVAKSDTQYSFNMLAAKPDPGFYFMDFKVEPKKPSSKYVSVDNAPRDVKVITTLAVSDLKVLVADSATKISDSETRALSAAHPAKIDETVRADQFQHILVSVRVKNAVSNRAMRPHQAFVRFTNSKTGATSSFRGSYDGKAVTWDINLSKVYAEFESESGSYTVDLLVGDAFVTNSLSWTIADASLTFAAAEYEAEPESPFAVKPEIEHVFRAPEPRPAAAVSMAFTAAALAPFAVLLIGLGRVGANVAGLSSSVSVPALVFHGSIGGILALYTLYWLRLNMFQTLGGLALLGTVAFFSGQRLLSALATGAAAKAHSD